MWEKWGVFFLVLIIILVLFYIGFACYLYFFQHRFVYHPGRKVLYTPADLGLEFESIAFKAEDGTRLIGWYVPCPESRGTALFCHGNAGNIGDRLDTIRKIYDAGLNTFIFDYRGYGESEGQTTEEGSYQDAEAAWRYLTEVKQVEPGMIIVWGRSLGAAIASWLAAKYPPRAVILESGFSSLQELGADMYPLLPVRYLSRFRYPTKEHISKLQVPILIIHSHEDPLIPFKHGQMNFKVAHEPKVFLEISGDHGNGFVTSGARYDAGVRNFINQHLG